MSDEHRARGLCAYAESPLAGFHMQGHLGWKRMNGVFVSPSTRHTDPLIPDQDGWSRALVESRAHAISSSYVSAAFYTALGEDYKNYWLAYWPAVCVCVCERSHDSTHT